MNQIDPIEAIHDSLVNGNRRQMVGQINEYGLYDFWSDYKHMLITLYDDSGVLSYFSDAVISYHRITSR